MGLRLRDVGTDEFSWHDLVVIVKHLPEASALRREVAGDDHIWDLHAHLLAMIADAQRWLVWAKTKDAEDGKNQPERIPRPGVEPPESDKRIEAVDIEEIEEWLATSAGFNAKPVEGYVNAPTKELTTVQDQEKRQIEA